jgi:hypothetical protein
MRRIVAILATFVLAQCAAGGERGRGGLRAAADDDALVIIGVAKAPRDTSPRYAMLWRRLDAEGAFERLSGDTSFEAETNRSDTVRVRGIPGEFEIARVAPGTYALDGVFALIRDRRVNYVAQGVIVAPERPAFEAHAGETLYLGIWEVDIQDANAVTRLWRLDSADARAVGRQAREVGGEVRLRETYTRAVPCAPHQASQLSTRQVC